MGRDVVLQSVSRLIIPLILLFALYVQFHGDFGPGGGFQAGVIFASAFILHSLVFGYRPARRVAPSRLVHALMAFGALLFGGVGVAGMLLGGNFLDYDVLATDPIAGQHLGILLVELGVGITVWGVMVTIFFAFVRRIRP